MECGNIVKLLYHHQPVAAIHCHVKVLGREGQPHEIESFKKSVVNCVLFLFHFRL